MKTLIAGASGSTGKKLVELLLKADQKVKAIIRQTSMIPEWWYHDKRIEIIKININELDTDEMSELLKDCQAIVSCLGHHISFKGIYGSPKRLVKDSIELICNAILKNSPTGPVKLILLNNAGILSKNLKEKNSFAESVVISILRILLPPHRDNEMASNYLQSGIGKENPYIKWVIARPDSLTDDMEVSKYSIHHSPTTSAIFNAGKTSRINLAHFMRQLIVDETIWNEWEGHLPVIYNDDK